MVKKQVFELLIHCSTRRDILSRIHKTVIAIAFPFLFFKRLYGGPYAYFFKEPIDFDSDVYFVFISLILALLKSLCMCHCVWSCGRSQQKQTNLLTIFAEGWHRAPLLGEFFFYFIFFFSFRSLSLLV